MTVVAKPTGWTSLMVASVMLASVQMGAADDRHAGRLANIASALHSDHAAN